MWGTGTEIFIGKFSLTGMHLICVRDNTATVIYCLIFIIATVDSPIQTCCFSTSEGLNCFMSNTFEDLICPYFLSGKSSIQAFLLCILQILSPKIEHKWCNVLLITEVLLGLLHLPNLLLHDVMAYSFNMVDATPLTGKMLAEMLITLSLKMTYTLFYDLLKPLEMKLPLHCSTMMYLLLLSQQQLLRKMQAWSVTYTWGPSQSDDIPSSRVKSCLCKWSHDLCSGLCIVFQLNYNSKVTLSFSHWTGRNLN